MDVTVQAINKIFLAYTPEYQHIKEIAEQDLGQELIDRIDKFLEERAVKPVAEIKKIIFEDPSKATQENVNDIVDAFVKIRSENTLEEIDKKSIDGILSLFHQWLTIGKDQRPVIPEDVFTEIREEPLNLEEQLSILEETSPKALYQEHTFEIARQIQNVYSQAGPEIYHEPPSSFKTDDHRHGENCAHYQSHSGIFYES